MNFVKKKTLSNNLSSAKQKQVKVLYFYKTDIEDVMDQDILLARALDEIEDNEDFNVIRFVDSIWFGISDSCKTCIYPGLEEDQSDDPTVFVKLVDSRTWKLNTGYMLIDNNYTKIIITSSKPPSELFVSCKKWSTVSKTFIVQKVN